MMKILFLAIQTQQTLILFLDPKDNKDTGGSAVRKGGSGTTRWLDALLALWKRVWTISSGRPLAYPVTLRPCIAVCMPLDW
jgi:hypothetical protein